MFAVGLMSDGASKVPTRTTVKPGRPVESEKSCVPHWGQKRRVTWFPLSATFVCWPTAPETSMDEVGKMTFTVPLEAMCWQSLHQQTREGPGSEVMR